MNDLEDLHQFVIVEFIATEEVGTVCKHWIKEDESGHLTCFWPEADVRKAKVNQKSPLPNWEPWKIRILSSCGVLTVSHGEGFTDKAFETKVKEWFRQAGTRIYNLSKKIPLFSFH